MANNTYLLDTQILIWWLTDHPRLTPQLSQTISNPNNLIFYSVANLWEISIKRSIGKLKLKIPFPQLVQTIPFPTLTIKPNHIITLHQLPLIHKDPFDRLLIAQALTENLTLITADHQITRYHLPTLTPQS